MTNKLSIKHYILGLQHVLAMFGSTVLVPFITGLDTSIALLCAGLGTLLFQLTTKGIVPVFLGSSFAFISAMLLVLKEYDITYLKGGIIASGVCYIFFAVAVKVYGPQKIKSFFPPIVLGPIIIAIGLKLSPIALDMSGYSMENPNYTHLAIAFITLLTMVGVSFLQKSFFRFMPIIVAIFVGFLTSMAFGLVDFSHIHEAAWFGLSTKATANMFSTPKFSLSVILIVAPISLVTFLEHLGDIQANGSVVGKDFTKDPGLHRTLLGDGLSTMLAGLLGGPASTTYAENTGVLAATKVYDPRILRIAAFMAIILAFMGKLTALIQSLPTPVMGGVSMMLFGLIATIGIKVIIEAKLDFNNYKNLTIPALILIVGIFVDTLKITEHVEFSGLFIATILGVIMNKILPER
ncbi:MAG: purine/pyrimidine permease [Alphaproteobacteria bacterium]|jgi:uracil permease|nr:purine/pyrimidine permease [Alphaproteobacteria bacterium]